MTNSTLLPGISAASETFDYENEATVEGRGILQPRARDIAGIRPARLLEALNRFLPAQPSAHPLVLEIGCGAGRYLRTLARYRSDLQLFGCDYSYTALLEARAADVRLRNYVRVDALALPYATAQFEAILLFDLLEHLPAPELALDEVSRVLQPGGLFHAFIPCEGNPQTLFNRLKQSTRWPIATWKKDYIGHIQQLESEQMLQALLERDFTILTANYSFHLSGQLYDIADYWTRDIDSRLALGELAPLQAKISRLFVRLLRIPLWRLTYYEDLWRKNDSRAVGLHVTARKNNCKKERK